MSISTVLTLGFGSFGAVKYLPTLGYDTSGLPPVIPPVVVGGHGKEQKRPKNEIIEIDGKRWVVPKGQVAEFLAQFEPKPAPVVEVKSPVLTGLEQTVRFKTPSGKMVTTTQQVLKDDIGVILVMCALADEDFYEE